MSRFSVIVPTHNGAETLPKALQSVRTQTFTDYELIVVCDACEDNSAEIAREYDAHVIEVDYHRDGLARNAGLDFATGEWILFLDDDDWFLHECVFDMLNQVCGKMGEDILNFSFIEKNNGYREQNKGLIFVMCWCRCCRREFIGDTRFNDLPYGSDRQFFSNLMAKQPNITFWNTPMYYYNHQFRSWKKHVESGDYR